MTVRLVEPRFTLWVVAKQRVEGEEDPTAITSAEDAPEANTGTISGAKAILLFFCLEAENNLLSLKQKIIFYLMSVFVPCSYFYKYCC